MLGKEHTPQEEDRVRTLLGTVSATQDMEKMYFATSSYEFGALLHRALMDDVHSDMKAYYIDREIYKLNVFTCLVYGDVVWSENAGLFVKGTRMYKPAECVSKYEMLLASLSLHFETLDRTEVLGVGISGLLGELIHMVECESHNGRIQRSEAVIKALTKAQNNIDNFDVDIKLCKDHVRVTYKG